MNLSCWFNSETRIFFLSLNFIRELILGQKKARHVSLLLLLHEVRLGGEAPFPHEEHHLQSTSGANVFADLGVDIRSRRASGGGFGTTATPSLAFRCFDHDLHFFHSGRNASGDELMIWIMRHYLLKGLYRG